MRRAFLFLLCGAACSHSPPTSSVERARGLLAHAAVRAGDLALDCEPPAAEVRVDGVPRGLCSDFDGEHQGLVLGAGMHEVDISHPGFWPQQTYYEPSGARVLLHVALESKGGAPASTP